ncbi:MAG: outer membrane beta-barrel protein [Myxococcota bacterium]
MRILATTGALLLAALFASTAQADDEIESHRTGPYIGVLFGAALPNFEGETFFTPPPFESRVEEQPSLAISGRAGVRVHKNIAIEGQYQWVREWDSETRNERCSKSNAQIITGNVKVFAPFDAVHPYLLGGVGAGRYKTSVRQVNFDAAGNACTPTTRVGFRDDHWELNLRVGGGFEVYLSRNVVLNVEASTIYSERRLLGESFPFVDVSGGLQYRF